ncbi:phosphopantetheine-binding protein [Pararhizobium sp. LjRoot238]|uniref:phosphopantetheine-binding protein n=1 Tax=Pararhizobium sp. LjRoot238 TaxID=3342293 RepID=UPI003ECCB128
MKRPFTREQMRLDIAAMIYADPDEIGADDNLMDLGLDSMRAMNLVLLWQERGITLDFSELAECPTLAGWWAVAQRRIPVALEA